MLGRPRGQGGGDGQGGGRIRGRHVDQNRKKKKKIADRRGPKKEGSVAVNTWSRTAHGEQRIVRE